MNDNGQIIPFFGSLRLNVLASVDLVSGKCFSGILSKLLKLFLSAQYNGKDNRAQQQTERSLVMTQVV